MLSRGVGIQGEAIVGVVPHSKDVVPDQVALIRESITAVSHAGLNTMIG